MFACFLENITAKIVPDKGTEGRPYSRLFQEDTMPFKLNSTKIGVWRVIKSRGGEIIGHLCLLLATTNYLPSK